MPVSSRAHFVSRSVPFTLDTAPRTSASTLYICMWFFHSGANPARPGAFPGANSPGPVADLYGPASQESAVGNYISAASPQPGSGFSHGIAVSITHLQSICSESTCCTWGKFLSVYISLTFDLFFSGLVFKSKFNCILMLKASLRGTFQPNIKFPLKFNQSAKMLGFEFIFIEKWSYLIKVCGTQNSTLKPHNPAYSWLFNALKFFAATVREH